MAKKNQSTAKAGQTGKRKKLKIDKEALNDLGSVGSGSIPSGHTSF